MVKSTVDAGSCDKGCRNDQVIFEVSQVVSGKLAEAALPGEWNRAEFANAVDIAGTDGRVEFELRLIWRPKDPVFAFYIFFVNQLVIVRLKGLLPLWHSTYMMS